MTHRKCGTRRRWTIRRCRPAAPSFTASLRAYFCNPSALLASVGFIAVVFEYAAAASCLKHSIELDVNLSTVAEVRQLMAGDGSGGVQR